MTKATAKKSKAKRILLLVAGLVLAVLIALGCVVLFVPGFWHPIDFFPQYSGILDSPITQITLWDIGFEVTFSDEDLLDQWEEGLQQLELQKTGTNIHLVPMTGSTNGITIQTETGEYYLSMWGNKIYLSCFVFTPNDSDYLPFEETFAAARQRHGLDDPA